MVLTVQLILLLFASVGWSRLITGYGGPFDVLNTVRDWLLPEERPVEPLFPADATDPAKITEWAMLTENYQIQLDIWRNYENYPKFPRTIKGYVYGIISCNVCILPYLVLFFTVLTFSAQMVAMIQYTDMIQREWNFFAVMVMTFFGISGAAVVFNEKVA